MTRINSFSGEPTNFDWSKPKKISGTQHIKDVTKAKSKALKEKLTKTGHRSFLAN